MHINHYSSLRGRWTNSGHNLPSFLPILPPGYPNFAGMEILGYLSALVVGILLGLMGGGGSILTVPILVYLLRINPLLATTCSLFIVGVTSFTGGIRAYTRKMVDFRAVTEFGIPSIFSIFITRHYLLPAFPDNLFTIGNTTVSKEMFLMVLFALLMLATSLSMLFNKTVEKNVEQEGRKINKPVLMVLLGLFIGMLTGILGAGGGFIIIPTLVLLLHVPMKTAVGTSLLIIGINSLFGFLFTLKQFTYDWVLLISFSLLAIIGIFIGSHFTEKIPAQTLKKSFGIFVLVMGVFILVKELFFKN